MEKAFGIELSQKKVLEKTKQLEMSGGFKGWLTGKNTDGEKIADGSYTDYLDSLLSTVIEIASTFRPSVHYLL